MTNPPTGLVAPVPYPPAVPRAARLAGALLSLVALAGCRVGVAVEVRAARGGGGEVAATVTLDPAAARRAGDVAAGLRLDDLRAAGWRVTGPTPAAGGAVVLRAAKAFSTPAGAALAVRELSGDAGPFRSLRLTTRRTLWRTTTTLRGAVDLSGGLEAFGDDTLRRLLGSPLGLAPGELEAELGRPPAEAFSFEVAARLPGTVRSDAPLRQGERVAWPVPLGRSVAVSATAVAWNAAGTGLAALAAGCGLALVVLLVRRSRRVSWG